MPNHGQSSQVSVVRRMGRATCFVAFGSIEGIHGVELA
jgi:hypothetical protein